MDTNSRHKVGWEEGIALGLLEEMGDPDPPMEAVALASLCHLRVELSSDRTARLVGDTIYAPKHTTHLKRQEAIAHEVGHWALANANESDSELGADYVGTALMLPQRSFSVDLRHTGWDMRELRAKHIHCSAEMIAFRIASLRDACVTLWDRSGKQRRRIWSPWLPPGYWKSSVFERQLAAKVLRNGDVIEAGALLWGFPDNDTGSVITVCEAEQLALRY